MPASSFDVYHIQNTKIDFNTTRPCSLGSNENEFLGQCQPIHISTNRYYGFHHTPEEIIVHDSEMTELQEHDVTMRVPNNARKRSAASDDIEIYQSKRVREENMVPSPSTHSPRLLQPTHNNPDLSRCLMVHMI